MKNINKPLRVLHFAQIPCKPFIVNVKDEYEAYKIINTLADQHLFLFDIKIIPDCSNILLVEMKDEDDDWVDYYNEEEGLEWSEVEEYMKQLTQHKELTLTLDNGEIKPATDGK